MKTKQTAQTPISGINRRTFLSHATVAAAGSAAWVSGKLAPLSCGAPGRRGSDESAPWYEADIPKLQALMASGELTSRELTQAYVRRIEELNPLLSVVIETNPQAVGLAAQLDAERRRAGVRGLLHGIPIL